MEHPMLDVRVEGDEIVTAAGRVPAPAVTVAEAQAVLWHLGDRVLGVEPGGFVSTLLRAISRADRGNRERLRMGFPGHVAAWVAAQETSWGLEWLRSKVKSWRPGGDAA